MFAHTRHCDDLHLPPILPKPMEQETANKQTKKVYENASVRGFFCLFACVFFSIDFNISPIKNIL